MPPREYSNRTLTIYFPTASELSELTSAALVAKLPVSHFSREMIRRGLDAPAPDISAIADASRDREELARLRRSLADSEAARQKLETELFSLRGALFLQPLPEGQGEFSRELIDLLQDGHVWRSHEIMKALNIDQKNIDAIKVLAGQLHALQDLKMIEDGPKGWRWLR